MLAELTMSLNEIQLQGKMLADLYRDVLISENPSITKQVKQSMAHNQNEKEAIRSLGKNKKNYCFIVSYANETFLPDDKMDVLPGSPATEWSDHRHASH